MEKKITHWAHFRCFKWPNIEKLMEPSGHTAQIHSCTSRRYNTFMVETQFFPKVRLKLHLNNLTDKLLLQQRNIAGKAIDKDFPSAEAEMTHRCRSLEWLTS